MIPDSPEHAVELLDRAFNEGDPNVVAGTSAQEAEISDASSQTFVATTVFRKQPDGTWKVLIDNSLGPLVLGSE